MEGGTWDPETIQNLATSSGAWWARAGGQQNFEGFGSLNHQKSCYFLGGVVGQRGVTEFWRLLDPETIQKLATSSGEWWATGGGVAKFWTLFEPETIQNFVG